MLGHLNSIVPQMSFLLYPSQVTTLKDLMIHAFVLFGMIFGWNLT